MLIVDGMRLKPCQYVAERIGDYVAAQEAAKGKGTGVYGSICVDLKRLLASTTQAKSAVYVDLVLLRRDLHTEAMQRGRLEKDVSSSMICGV